MNPPKHLSVATMASKLTNSSQILAKVDKRQSSSVNRSSSPSKVYSIPKKMITVPYVWSMKTHVREEKHEGKNEGKAGPTDGDVEPEAPAVNKAHPTQHIVNLSTYMMDGLNVSSEPPNPISLKPEMPHRPLSSRVRRSARSRGMRLLVEGSGGRQGLHVHTDVTSNGDEVHKSPVTVMEEQEGGKDEATSLIATPRGMLASFASQMSPESTNPLSPTSSRPPVAPLIPPPPVKEYSDSKQESSTHEIGSDGIANPRALRLELRMPGTTTEPTSAQKGATGNPTIDHLAQSVEIQLMSPEKAETPAQSAMAQDISFPAPQLPIAMGQNTVIFLRNDERGLGRFNKKGKRHNGFTPNSNGIKLSTSPAPLLKNTKRAPKKISSLPPQPPG